MEPQEPVCVCGAKILSVSPSVSQSNLASCLMQAQGDEKWQKQRDAHCCYEGFLSHAYWPEENWELNIKT